MTNTTHRLQVGAAVLAAVDHRRHGSQDPSVGSGIERFIIDRELRELEEEILANPGPLLTILVTSKRTVGRPPLPHRRDGERV